MARIRKDGLSIETFGEFLAEQGMLESVEDYAVKELTAEQLADTMAGQGLIKIEMAARMKASRRQLDRLFDPAIPSVTLDTLRRAGSAVGRSLRIDLVWCREYTDGNLAQISLRDSECR
jgi:antitoxin HicB